MAQRTWIPRAAGRTEAPGDGGRLSAAPASPAGDGRTAARLARAAAQAGPGWLWPHWLERQLDPRSPGFLPGGDLALRHNLTGRNWTAIGNLDSTHHATVDPRGLVTPGPGGWSLDWWVGADDRWHVPAREAAVRQRLVGAAPVVETALRIPTGDALHRAYAIRRSSPEGGGELVVVEVENRSKLPVALALAVRPYGPAGLAPVGRVELDGAGTTVSVDSDVAVLLPRVAARFAASAADGESAATVLGGDAAERWPGDVRCPDGLAQAAFVFPLAHGASLRVVLPVGRERPGRRAGAGVAFPTAVPSADQVAAGWASQAGRGMRVELPDARLAEAVDANRRFLLLRPAGAEALGALDAYGYHDEAAAVLAGYPARQRADGGFGERDRPGATGAALWALGRHWALARRPVADDVVEALARGAQWVERARRGPGLRRGARRDVAAPEGLLPAGRVPARAGAEVSYADDAWAVAGLRAAAAALAGCGQAPAATQVAREAGALWSDLERSWAEAAGRLSPTGAPAAPAIPAGPRRPVDAGAAAVLAACTLGLVDAADERIAATAEALRTGHVVAEGEAVYDPDRSGLSPAATLALAGVELRVGDDRALARLAWLVGAASDTWAWPTAIHPRLGGGTAGDGHDPAVVAAFLLFVRDLLVREAPDGLVLSSLVPGSWLGQGWEVHDAPTAHGNLSYAVRWHGDRPALLWDLEAHEGVGPVRLTIPGLDPGWSTTERRGEALLAAVAAPEGVDVGAGEVVADAPAPSDAVAFPAAPRPPAGPAAPRPPAGHDNHEPGSLS